jgi:hypothetical protein
MAGKGVEKITLDEMLGSANRHLARGADQKTGDLFESAGVSLPREFRG